MIVGIISSLLIVALIVLLIAVVAVLVAALTLGLAWALTVVFPVSIMEAAVVLMFAAGAFVFYITLSLLADAIRDRPSLFSPLLDENWLEDEEDWEEEPTPSPSSAWRKPPIRLPSMPSRTSTSQTRRKVGRNEPCPCGSGKKYKNCCGR